MKTGKFSSEQLAPGGAESMIRVSTATAVVVSALALLHDLASGKTLPAGARFETFAYADRVLGVELAREIGQPGG